MPPSRKKSGFPHPRGDGPPWELLRANGKQISPPTWGWPAGVIRRRLGGVDFPTHVGMARFVPVPPNPWVRFPHPRGDGPASGRGLLLAVEISPPTWGWPIKRQRDQFHFGDFPTHVGMARQWSPPRCRLPRFPHPRGDGAYLVNAHAVLHQDFPTCVGIVREWPRRRMPVDSRKSARCCRALAERGPMEEQAILPKEKSQVLSESELVGNQYGARDRTRT